MPSCPRCLAPLPVLTVLRSRAPDGNFDRNAMRFTTACQACGARLGLEPGAVRLFFVAWLCPLPVLCGLASVAGAGPGLPLLALPLLWFLSFPPFWLHRTTLTECEDRQGRAEMAPRSTLAAPSPLQPGAPTPAPHERR